MFGVFVGLLLVLVLLTTNKAAAPGGKQQTQVTHKQPQSTKAATGATSAPSSEAPFQHRGIVTTIFWAGEPADSDNGYISNAASAWDETWQQHYGGVDDPAHRNGYFPASFTPHENPFYFALPYDDVTDSGTRKVTAGACPGPSRNAAYSWCKNAWLAIRYHGKTVYAQWEDVGPYETDDTSYVFGSAQPRNGVGAGAGLDASPAVRDYLGLSDVSNTDWQFVKATDVPGGPWRTIITTSLGNSLD